MRSITQILSLRASIETILTSDTYNMSQNDDQELKVVLASVIST